MNEYIQLSNDVKLADMNGNEYIIFKMYCNITAGKSMSFTYDILMDTAFEANKTLVQTKVSEFKAYCEDKARECGVPIF